MKSTALISSLLVGGGALATSIVVSQNTSSDPMNNFIEYKEDERTPLQSVQKIGSLIKNVKDVFKKLKEKIEIYEKSFGDYKEMLNDSKEKVKMGVPRAKELARTNFLAKNLELLLEKKELLNSKKESLQKEKDALQEKIKEIENKGKEYSNSDDGKIKDISKLAGDFSEEIQKLYEELFLFFKQYSSLISKNIGINRKKSLSALLSTAEKVGLLEKKENTNYISSNLKFTKTFNTSDHELMSEINKNSNFKVDNKSSTLTLEKMDTDIWSFFDWNKDGKNDLSDWDSWIKNI